jgi:hypothetical protein
MRIAAILILWLGLAPFGAGASASERSEPGAEPDLAREIYDLTVLRPLDTVQVVVGAAFFVPLYPLSLVLGGTDDVVDYCIRAPVERAFRRPLGRL